MAEEPDPWFNGTEDPWGLRGVKGPRCLADLAPLEREPPLQVHTTVLMPDAQIDKPRERTQLLASGSAAFPLYPPKGKGKGKTKDIPADDTEFVAVVGGFLRDTRKQTIENRLAEITRVVQLPCVRYYVKYKRASVGFIHFNSKDQLWTW
eukprot:269074-Amphidinium_carterae.1